MIKLRVLSAVVLLPLVLGIIYLGGWAFRGLVILVILGAGAEYAHMLHRKDYAVSMTIIWATALVWCVDAIWGDGTWLGTGLAFLLLLSAAGQLFHHHVKDPTATWALALAGGMYLGMGGAYLLRLRALPDGLWWTLTALPVVWIADSAAYSVGRRWGVHKMAPELSPGKSWEGYAAEVVAGLLSGLLLGMLWPYLSGGTMALSPWRGLLLGGILAVLTPLGDFFVSMVKREVGVKDSGNLIPGHGGLFDRIDSLVWTGVLSWFFLLLLR